MFFKQNVILKKDFANNNGNASSDFKIIDNFDDSLENEYDAIMKDIQNMITKKSANDLLLGTIENQLFNLKIKVKDYFSGGKYKHLYISDLKNNIYFIDQNGEINTAKLSNSNSFFSLMNKDNLLNIKNIDGNKTNETIIGDNSNNIIHGLGGIDNINGNAGDDVLTVLLDRNFNHNDKNNILNNLLNNTHSKVSGGEGSDTYIVNIENINTRDSNFILSIDNFDNNESMDNLFLNDEKNIISNVYFEKIDNNLKISFINLDLNNEYIIVVNNWFSSIKNRHIQIQIGNKLTINGTILNQITDYLTKIKFEYTESQKTLNSYFPLISEIYYYFKPDDFNVINKKYTVNMKDKFLRESGNLIKLETNNYSIIDVGDLSNEVNKFDFLKSYMSKNLFKIFRIDNDLLIHHNENLTYLLLKNYYLFDNRKFKLMFNNKEIVTSNAFDKITSDLDNGSFFDISI